MPEGGASDGFGEGGVGSELVVERRVLAGGFDAVGGDGKVNGSRFEGSGRRSAIGDRGKGFRASWGHGGSVLREAISMIANVTKQRA